jgi:tRNA-2-methylthio-N6-dimethylallyladenosine synthase
MTLTRFQSVAQPDGADQAPRLHVVTFGCQMNKYDSLLVEGRFKQRGYVTTERLEDADVVLFNTCSVREHAEERTWSWLGELKRAKERRPEMVIGVMGCMAQRVQEQVFARAGHVDLVAGTRQFQRMPELVDELRERREHPERFEDRARRVLATGMDLDVAADREQEDWLGGRHGWLAVMRGCDLSCTFCIVPTVRGRVKSRPIAELVREARWMVERGAQVLTLLGQTVNSYGEDFPAPGPGAAQARGRQGREGLADLLFELQELEGLARIRLVTLHPAYATEALAEAIRDCDKVERFLPLPAQSGSDAVLKRMKRGYTTDLYRRRLDVLRAHLPDLELASDWIVGFPGETDGDFEASMELLGEVGFVTNYIFKYDPRPGTAADERLDDDVPLGVKKERNQRLLRRSEEVALARLSTYVGSVRHVLAEDLSTRREGLLLGRDRHGLAVSFPGTAAELGLEHAVTIESASPFGLAGRRASEPGPGQERG